MENYCRSLTALSQYFEVEAPVLWTDGGVEPDYAKVAETLPFAAFDQRWPEAAAFLVDLEWLPALNGSTPTMPQRWSRMGSTIVHLLARRYPDVPCFLMSSEWSVEMLPQGLAHGAAWCFRKPKFQADGLTPTELRERLNSTAEIRHGAFPEVPFPAQFRMDVSANAGRQLLNKLDLRLPLEESAAGRDLQRSVATLFPQASHVWPVTVLGYGLSGASATFLAGTQYAGSTGATRFVKLGTWPMIQREYLGYRRVIQPRLNSYVAGLVERSVVTSGRDGLGASGSIAYTLAGFPEGYLGLRSLNDLLAAIEHDPEAGKRAAKALQRTLDTVVRPLHGEGDGDVAAGRRVRRPLWHWLGTVLPPAVTGVLVAHEGSLASTVCLHSYQREGYKPDVARLLSAEDLMDALRPAPAGCVSTDGGRPIDGSLVRLCAFALEDVEWKEGDDTAAELTLVHPDLGLRVRLRGCARDLREQFDLPWVHPGLLVDVVAVLDRNSRDQTEMTQRIQTAFALCGLGDATGDLAGSWAELIGRELADPLMLLQGPDALSAAFTIEALEGPIHGDLNVRNILFPAGDLESGWLIDFERATERGMVAHDLAKLEVEIIQHHLLPALLDLADVLALGASERIRLANAALVAIDTPEMTVAAFCALATAPNLAPLLSPQLLRRACDVLLVIAEVRTYARKVRVSDPELRWALGVYACVATKFKAAERPWRAVLLWFTSAWHLARVMPTRQLLRQDWQEPLTRVARSGPRAVGDCELDSLLRRTRREEPAVGDLTHLMAGGSDDRRPRWPTSVPERWDVASTGSVANITPLMGYLWLMTRARRCGDMQAAPPLVVPKISSRGTSCGTVDVLESGGLRFPSDPEVIVQACLTSGGVLCKQGDDLTPVDAALMRRRRATNSMKDARLTVASVLGKKLAMGCTHAVVDVKLGRDTKFLAPGLDGALWRPFLDGGGELMASRQIELFRQLLNKLGVPMEQLMVETTAGDHPYLRQIFPEGDGSLREVRWVLTSADMPQCRAVGRQLLLLHIEGLVRSGYSWAGDQSETLLEYPDYDALYRRVLPQLCGIDDPSWKDLAGPWDELVARLPRMVAFPARQCPERWLREPATERIYDLSDLTQDLAVVTLGAHPYCATTAPLRVRAIDAYALDRLFGQLCGPDQYDADVGIWLHRIPGETIHSDKDPVMSVFFRPSRSSQRDVLGWMRAFLRNNVVVERAL